MKPKTLSFLLIYFLLTNYANSQSLNWAQAMAGKDFDSFEKIAIDKEGNIFSMGNFGSTAKIGFDSTFNLTSFGRYDSFIMKQNSNGKILWVQSCGGKDFDYGTALALDSKGNSYMVGTYYNDSLKFSNSDTVIPNKGFYDSFVVKYSPSGELLSVKTFTEKGYQYIEAIELDNQDNVYLHGNFNTKFDMDFTSNTKYIDDVESLSLFTIKYTPNLDNVIYYSIIQSINGSVGRTEARLAVSPNGTAFVGGTYSRDLVHHALPDQNDTIYSNGNLDGFISCISPEGKILFTKTIGGAMNDYVYSLHTLFDTRVFVGGVFNDTCFFNNKKAVSNGFGDAFCADYSINGNLNIVFTFGGESDENLHSVYMLQNGFPIMVGEFENKIISADLALYSQGKKDVFVYFPVNYLLKTNGFSLGGEGINEGNFLIVKNKFPSDLELLLAGQFSGKMNLADGATITCVNERDTSDGYILSYSLPFVEQSVEEDIQDEVRFIDNDYFVKANSISDNNSTYEIFNSLGNKVLSGVPSNQEIFIDKNELQNGLYFLRIKSKNRHYTHKFYKLKEQ